MSNEPDPLSVVEQLYAAHNGQRLDLVARLYHENAIHEDVAHGKPKIGVNAIRNGLGKFFGWFPDASWKVHSIIWNKGNEVAVAYTLSGSLQTPMGPVTARGQKISLRGIQVLWIAKGRIQRSEDYWDAMTFQKQLTFNNPEEKS